MAEPKLKGANTNPWYVLMTLWGEQEGEDVDWDLHEKNRNGWHAWACRDLNDDTIAGLVRDTGLERAELEGWAGIKAEIERRFAKRLPKAELPDPGKTADLREITFTQDAVFNSATFTQDAWFDSATFTQAAWFHSATFAGFCKFVRTHFKEGSNFNDCHFEKPTSFRDAQFLSAYPRLSGAVLHQNTHFTAEDIVSDEETGETIRLWPKTVEDQKSARNASGIIRHALAGQGRPEDEHFFFRKEMGFNAEIGGFWQSFPYRAFRELSEFGYSISRPLLWLGLLIIFLWGIYGIYFGSLDFTAAGRTVPDQWRAGLGFSVSNTLPGFGFGRYYFETGFHASLDWPIKLIAGVQSVFSVTLLFFFGLGLRTRFRLR